MNNLHELSITVLMLSFRMSTSSRICHPPGPAVVYSRRFLLSLVIGRPIKHEINQIMTRVKALICRLQFNLGELTTRFY